MPKPAEDTFVSYQQPIAKRLPHVPLIPRTSSPTLGLREFVASHSTIPSLKQCARQWFFHCGLAICPWCAPRKAERRVAEWSSLTDITAPSVYARLSVETHHDVGVAWDRHRRTRDRFAKRSWLSSTSSYWLRSTELTAYRGLWHWHDNIVVFGTPEQLNHVEHEIAHEWAVAADKENVNATKGAQYALPSRSTADVMGYVLKGLMAPASDPARGHTPADLLGAYWCGDADAGELWDQIEMFVKAQWDQDGKHRRAFSLTNRSRRQDDFDLTA